MEADTPVVASYMANLRDRLVAVALEWERTFGVAPSITSTLSEYDAAWLIGHTNESYGKACIGRTAVTRGCDFICNGLRYQVKANRPSGKPGSFVTLVGKAANFNWDFLVWVLYDRMFQLQEAWLWDVKAYRQRFEFQKRLSPNDMRAGKALHALRR